uniref:Transmembrane protein n=1 Tax=Engystomops pustulosus TaxID=76066 RepID=A0AAV6Z109_ENGPU|nr:hypothetical protein GDO81_028146 [Engystomops pustulosus]
MPAPPIHTLKSSRLRTIYVSGSGTDFNKNILNLRLIMYLDHNGRWRVYFLNVVTLFSLMGAVCVMFGGLRGAKLVPGSSD